MYGLTIVIFGLFTTRVEGNVIDNKWRQTLVNSGSIDVGNHFFAIGAAKYSD